MYIYKYTHMHVHIVMLIYLYKYIHVNNFKIYTVLVMHGWRLYQRAGNKKIHSDYLRVDRINH